MGLIEMAASYWENLRVLSTDEFNEACYSRNEVIFNNLKLDGENNNVLDFGCGNGRTARLLAESVSKIKVTGYDNYDDIIKIANKKCWSKFTENINFTSSFQEINNNKPYDNIISSFMLDTLEESTPEILKDFNNLLSPKGVLIIFFYNIKGKDIDNFSFYAGEEINTVRNMGVKESLQTWSKNGTSYYIKSVQDAGLTVLKTNEVPRSKGKYSYLVAQKLAS